MYRHATATKHSRDFLQRITEILRRHQSQPSPVWCEIPSSTNLSHCHKLSVVGYSATSAGWATLHCRIICIVKLTSNDSELKLEHVHAPLWIPTAQPLKTRNLILSQKLETVKILLDSSQVQDSSAEFTLPGLNSVWKVCNSISHKNENKRNTKNKQVATVTALQIVYTTAPNFKGT